MAERKLGCGCVPDMLAPPLTPHPRATSMANTAHHPQKQFPSRQMDFNDKKDYTTISIRDNTIKTLLKQLRTKLK